MCFTLNKDTTDNCMCKDFSVSCSLSSVFWKELWTQANSSQASGLLHKDYTGNQTTFIWFPRCGAARFKRFFFWSLKTWGHNVMLLTGFTCLGSCWLPPACLNVAIHFFHNVWMLSLCCPVNFQCSCWFRWLLTFKWVLMLGDVWVLRFTVAFGAQLEVWCTEVGVSWDSASAACILSLGVYDVDQDDRWTGAWGVGRGWPCVKAHLWGCVGEFGKGLWATTLPREGWHQLPTSSSKLIHTSHHLAMCIFTALSVVSCSCRICIVEYCMPLYLR